MRLVDADKLIEEGWILTRHGVSNKVITSKSIADVPTAFDPNDLLKELYSEIDCKRFICEPRYVTGIKRAIDIIKEYFK